jgi:hypothetical protein
MIIIVSLIRVWDEWKSNPAARHDGGPPSSCGGENHTHAPLGQPKILSSAIRKR